MLFSFIKTIKLLLSRTDILQCLVRKIDPNRIDEALELEYREFYLEPSDGNVISQLFMEKQFKPFLAKLRPGDELWFYQMPQEYWEELMGHQGYVIVRKGRIVAQVVTRYN